MLKNKNLLSNTIPVFPLSNFIIFPKTTVPLNIFEERYLSMVDDAMKKDKLIGMIQPANKNDITPNVYKIGCVGKIVSYNETNDGRYLIVLNGISRFNIIKEIENRKLYREFDVSYEEFKNDQLKIDEKLDFETFDSIFVKLKSYFDKQGYSLNWEE
jgi:Lon protease-like protein